MSKSRSSCAGLATSNLKETLKDLESPAWPAHSETTPSRQPHAFGQICEWQQPQSQHMARNLESGSTDTSRSDPTPEIAEKANGRAKSDKDAHVADGFGHSREACDSLATCSTKTISTRTKAPPAMPKVRAARTSTMPLAIAQSSCGVPPGAACPVSFEECNEDVLPAGRQSLKPASNYEHVRQTTAGKKGDLPGTLPTATLEGVNPNLGRRYGGRRRPVKCADGIHCTVITAALRCEMSKLPSRACIVV